MGIDYWTTIGEIAEVFDGPHATPKKIEEGPYFLSISSLENGKLDLSKSARLSEEQFVKWTKRVTPQEGDVLFSYETRLGEAALMPSGIKACLGRRMGLLRPNLAKVDPRYLLFAFLGPDFQKEIRARTNSGATVDRIAIKELPGFPIKTPPLSEQKAIAHVLGTIDDRIELNRQMNETLEAMAQALFKSWFVDFDPVIDNALANGKEIPEELGEKAQARAALGDKRRPLPEEIRALFPDEFAYREGLGWIPTGWMICTLGEELDFATGPVFKSKDFSDQGIRLDRGDNVKEGYFQWGEKTRYWPEITQNLKKYELKTGDILIGMDGSKVGKNWVRVCSSDLPCLLVQRVARLRPNKSLGSTLLEVLIGGEMFRRYVENVKTGTSIPHISGGQIKNFPILNPGDEGKLFCAFESLFKAAAKRREENLAQNNLLANLRDTLLPKLLSGELRIPDAEKIFERIAG